MGSSDKDVMTEEVAEMNPHGSIPEVSIVSEGVAKTAEEGTNVVDAGTGGTEGPGGNDLVRISGTGVGRVGNDGGEAEVWKAEVGCNHLREPRGRGGSSEETSYEVETRTAEVDALGRGDDVDDSNGKPGGVGRDEPYRYRP